MICESCKNTIPENARYCPKCGVKIEHPQSAPTEGVQKDVSEPAAAQIPSSVETASEPSSAQAVSTASSAETQSKETASSDSKGESVLRPVQTEKVVSETDRSDTVDKQKSAKLPLIIVLVVLFVAAAAGGYYYYAQYYKKEPSKSEIRTTSPGQTQAQQQGGMGQPQQQATQSESQPAGPSQQAQPAPYTSAVQPGSGGQAAPQREVPMEPTDQEQYGQLPQQRTRVVIKSSALAADFRSGRPIGLSTNFRYGASRVVHYVQYSGASVGVTSLSSQYYRDGRMLFKCGPTVLQYKSGKYFCRPQQDLTPGAYEVRFFVDGNEEQILKFRVE